LKGFSAHNASNSRKDAIISNDYFCPRYFYIPKLLNFSRWWLFVFLQIHLRRSLQKIIIGNTSWTWNLEEQDLVPPCGHPLIFVLKGRQGIEWLLSTNSR
jgi:hypothetical protein